MGTKTLVIECTPEEWASHCTDYTAAASLEEMVLGYVKEKSEHADECDEADECALVSSFDPIRISDKGKVQFEVIVGNEDDEDEDAEEEADDDE